jgi:hypothetical protein
MNEIVKAQEVGGLIFQPAETLNKRVIEAENEAKDLRKQRSRAVMLAIMAFVALLTMALSALFFLVSANARADRETAAREEAFEQLKNLEIETKAQVEAAKNEAEVARRQLTGVYGYINIASERIRAVQQKGRLDEYRAFYADKATAGLDLTKSFNVPLRDWNVEGLTRENYVAMITAGYTADAKTYEDAVKVVEDWMVRTAQPSRPKSDCLDPPNPYNPSPRDCLRTPAN